jgi:hypothetical protein
VRWQAQRDTALGFGNYVSKRVELQESSDRRFSANALEEATNIRMTLSLGIALYLRSTLTGQSGVALRLPPHSIVVSTG